MKKAPNYHSLRRNLTEEIQSAFDTIVEKDFVEDIEIVEEERKSRAFYKIPYVKVLRAAGNALLVSARSIDQFGRRIGYKAVVKCRDWGHIGYEGAIRAIEAVVPKRAEPHPRYS